ncbi:MAG: UDP-2,3-diacylglucosamine diphosphatase LpxI [Candidatus Marinimicrobia bacterium]|nr:UDP-2,3-diacylglucosamine diphosphatase LpxI [Candidatus Neomarinimicrobiota bacterium]
MEDRDQSTAGAIQTLGLIAGNGVYPRLLAEAARQHGVTRIHALAFKGETERALARVVDQITWLRLGQLEQLLGAVRSSGLRDFVMVGQITPTRLYTVLPDRRLLTLLRGLPQRNAHTIYGALIAELQAAGAVFHPAHLFMDSARPAAGQLSARAPDEREWADIRLGLTVARQVSRLEIGQTVVIKEGTVLAVEAFEGTDAAILRAGRLGRGGLVVVKVAKQGHDMRFDIPVIGQRTLRTLRRAGVSALAVEAERAIILERDAVVAAANTMNLAWVALPAEGAVQ